MSVNFRDPHGDNPQWPSRNIGLALLLIAVCFTVAFVGLSLYKQSAERQGALKAEAVALTKRNKVLQDSNRVLLTVAKVESVKTVQTVTKWRTVAAATLAPTVVIRETDTLYVPATARESTLVAFADTAINQCLLTLSICQQRSILLDSMIAVSSKQLTVEKARKPSWLARTRTALFHGLIGAAIVAVVFR